MAPVRSARLRWFGVGLLLILPPLAGCGKGTGFVTGTVTYKGQPLTSGAITFHGADGRVDSGVIGPDGSYTIAQAPTGPVTVTVTPAQERSGPRVGGPSKDKPEKHPGEGKLEKPPGGGHPSRGGPVKIPPKYQKAAESGLSYTVKSGKQTIDVRLE